MNYIGYFGKLPQKGDFIQHGMAMDEKDSWDAWLQEGIVVARELLASAWSASYAYRTVWRFFAGERGGRRAGVMLFSHDRVGREFPFVALFGDAMDPARAPNLAVGDIDASLAFAERLVTAAYDGLLPAEQLATLLQNLPWQRTIGETLRACDGTLSTYTSSERGQPFVLEAVLLHALIGNGAAVEPRSLWWRFARDNGLERVVVNSGERTSHLFHQLVVATEGPAAPTSGSAIATQPVAEPTAGRPAVPQSEKGVNADPVAEDPVDFNSLLG